MSYYDGDSHERVRYKYDFHDENRDFQSGHVQDERHFGYALAAYGRFVAATSDVIKAHGASCLNVLTRKEGSTPRQARVLSSWVRIDSLAEPSLFYGLSGDCA
jgi:hypothetical protein